MNDNPAVGFHLNGLNPILAEGKWDPSSHLLPGETFFILSRAEQRGQAVCLHQSRVVVTSDREEFHHSHLRRFVICNSFSHLLVASRKINAEPRLNSETSFIAAE